MGCGVRAGGQGPGSGVACWRVCWRGASYACQPPPPPSPALGTQHSGAPASLPARTRVAVQVECVVQAQQVRKHVEAHAPARALHGVHAGVAARRGAGALVSCGVAGRSSCGSALDGPVQGVYPAPAPAAGRAPAAAGSTAGPARCPGSRCRPCRWCPARRRVAEAFCTSVRCAGHAPRTRHRLCHRNHNHRHSSACLQKGEGQVGRDPGEEDVSEGGPRRRHLSAQRAQAGHAAAGPRRGGSRRCGAASGQPVDDMFVRHRQQDVDAATHHQQAKAGQQPGREGGGGGRARRWCAASALQLPTTASHVTSKPNHPAPCCSPDLECGRVGHHIAQRAADQAHARAALGPPPLAPPLLPA